MIGPTAKFGKISNKNMILPKWNRLVPGRVSACDMSDKFDYYRAIAAYCERMFREATTLEMKTSWLRLAMNWRALIPAQPESGKAVPQPVPPIEPAE